MKGFQSYLLEEQYRMCPACSSFPRKQFYDDKGLKDSAMVKKDTVDRQAVRQLSLNRGQDGVIVICQAVLLAEVLKKNRGKHYNAVVNLISGAQERSFILSRTSP